MLKFLDRVFNGYPREPEFLGIRRTVWVLCIAFVALAALGG